MPASPEKVDHRFDRPDILPRGRKERLDGDFATGVEGNNVIRNFPAGLQPQNSTRGIDPGDLILQKHSSAVLNHLPDVEPDLLGTIDPGKHPRTHARIVLMSGRHDHRDSMASLNVTGQIQQNREVSMPAPHQNQILSHLSSAPFPPAIDKTKA